MFKDHFKSCLTIVSYRFLMLVNKIVAAINNIHSIVVVIRESFIKITVTVIANTCHVIITILMHLNITDYRSSLTSWIAINLHSCYLKQSYCHSLHLIPVQLHCRYPNNHNFLLFQITFAAFQFFLLQLGHHQNRPSFSYF